MSALFALAVLRVAGAAPSADVVASGPVPAPPEAVYEYLRDIRHHQELWPTHCAKNWQYGSTLVGPGASARLTYSVLGLNRRLTATLSKADPDRRVTVDHAGKKGFITTWTISPQGEGSWLEVRTWLNPPPKPFQKAYYAKIQPELGRCHEQILDKIDTVIRREYQPMPPADPDAVESFQPLQVEPPGTTTEDLDEEPLSDTFVPDPSSWAPVPSSAPERPLPDKWALAPPPVFVPVEAVAPPPEPPPPPQVDPPEAVTGAVDTPPRADVPLPEPGEDAPVRIRPSSGG